MTRWIVPPLRRCVQLLAVVVLVALPVLALYTHYKEARAIGDLAQNDWRATAVRGVDRFVGDSDARRRLVAETQGTIWSARLLGVSLTDPLAGMEAIVSSRSFYPPLLWSLLIPLAATLLLGRVFCGWICPMNTLLELVDKCRALLRLAEIREHDVRFSLRNKYVVLVLAIGFVAFTGVPFLAMIYPPAVLSREMHAFVFGGGLGVGAFLILAICAVELFVSRRWWCRYICPGGGLYSLLGRFRLLRVRRNAGKCTQCGDCVRTCQFGLRPMLVHTTGMECTNCAACIAGCAPGALGYRLVLPGSGRGRNSEGAGDPLQLPVVAAPTANPPQKDERSARISAAGKSAIVLLCVLLLPASAAAHHILGLPHYSYKENYPQAPTLEYPATTGPYDVLLTSYPGKPVPGEAATLAFYIKDRTTGRPYEKPVAVRVLKTSTFGSNQVVQEPTTRLPFDNQHKYTVTFPDDGEYITELTLEVEGQWEVIPFLMIAGEPTATWSIVVAIGAGLTVFVVVVRAIKVKRDRKQKQLQAARAKAAEAKPAVV